MSSINLGRVRPVSQGDYDSGRTYVALDYVAHNGSTWLAVRDIPAGVAPQANDTTYWVLFGEKGEKGDKGDKGDTGPQGPPGADGADGEQGPKGDMPGHKWTGTVLAFQGPDGEYADGVDLVGPQGPAGPAGADGVQGVKGDMPAHKWNGTKLSFQDPDGEYGAEVDLVGPQGPQGKQGIQGIQGEKGEQGEQGPQGKEGPQGPAVPLSDSVTSTSHTDAASSYAVKQAYDKGNSALTKANTNANSITELAGTVDVLESDATALQTAVNELERLRKLKIGCPMYWRSSTLPEGYAWANGDFVEFADWPELEEVYNSGGFAGLLLPWDADEEEQAANLGKFRPDSANPTGLYTPNLSGQFFRACGGSELSGTWHRDEIRNITGTTGEMLQPSASTGAFRENVSPGKRNHPDGVFDAGTLVFDASYVVPTGSENVPVHVHQPCVIYLGRQ